MSYTKYINIDTRINEPISYIELPETLHHVKSLTVTNLEIPLFFSLHDASNSEINANLIDSTIYYPRYVYLELIDYKNKHHDHCYLFS